MALPVLLSLLFSLISAKEFVHLHERHPAVPPLFFGRPPGGIVNNGLELALRRAGVEAKPILSINDPNAEPLKNWFDQKIDHFDPLGTATYKQKYYYNPKWYNPSITGSDIIFLMIGGEARETGRWIVREEVQYLQWAKKYGAAVFDLEHRFFGDSWPIPDMTTESLKYLTTEQALADLATFIVAMNKKHNFQNPKWVTFGGSYPGALSAWFKQKYPDLTVGAIASSGPVNLKLDFYEYAMVVNDVIKATDINCYNNVADAFNKIQKYALSTEGRNTLNTIFHLSPPFDSNTKKADITNFYENLYNAFQGMIQYTYDGSSNDTAYSLTAAKICENMNNANEPDTVKRVYNLVMWYQQFYPTGLADTSIMLNNYQSQTVDYLGQTNISQMDDGAVEYRGWMWLCCNEIGYLQTTDQGRNIFGSTVPLNYFIDTCTDIFGTNITADFVRPRNLAAQNFYGGAVKYEAVNVTLPNGKFDPWHALGYYTSPENAQRDADNHVHSVLIDGAAHCSDMYPVYPDEPTGLVAARAAIQADIEYFIGIRGANGDPNDSSTSSTTSTTATPTTSPSSLTSVFTSFVLLLSTLYFLRQ